MYELAFQDPDPATGLLVSICISIRQGTDASSPRGRRIGYREVSFESGARPHSRFVAGVVEANTLHPDYARAARRPESRLAYAALLIGKETIAFNDRTGQVGDFLEKLLDFHFRLTAERPWRGRKPREREQEQVDLPET